MKDKEVFRCWNTQKEKENLIFSSTMTQAHMNTSLVTALVTKHPDKLDLVYSYYTLKKFSLEIDI